MICILYYIYIYLMCVIYKYIYICTYIHNVYNLYHLLLDIPDMSPVPVNSSFVSSFLERWLISKMGMCGDCSVDIVCI